MILDKKQLAFVSIFILSVLLISPALVATTSVVTGNSSSTSKATFDLTAVFDSRYRPSPQPSPYCNIGSATGPFVIMCYTPQDVKTAYNYPSHLDGSGQTIVIVDAFGSPTVQSDLDTFDQAFGLPSTTIQIACENNSCPVFNSSNADQVGWTQEIALDTQYAHAMAPGAHIVLFVATSDDDLVLEQAVQQAVNMFPHSIISQSFGDPELDLLTAPATYVHAVLTTGEAAYEQAAREGITVFASAGDWGADNSPFGFTSASPGYPSSSPWVTAVGGTMGNPYYLGAIPSCTGRTCSTGLVAFLNTPSCQLNTPTPTATASCTPVGYGGEQVWNEPAFGLATGGAPSLIFRVPFYQHDLRLTARTTPDVSYNAPIDGGVIGYWSVIPSAAGFYIFGGTSAGSPQWSAIAALADQLATMHHRGTIGFINPALYSIGNNRRQYQEDFHDITVGNNIVAGSPNNVGFYAHLGWDDASGWGTPNVANLVPDLVGLSW
jgi:subtilase family serine protease